MKRLFCTTLALLFILSCFPLSAAAEQKASAPALEAVDGTLALNCKSAVLMDANTGTVLYRQNESEALPPASVTKIMTLLLVMEALDAGKIKAEDLVTASATAAAMGGSQIYLEEGESMSVEDLIKSVVISSANDAAVALAEHVSGDLESFVKQMNDKASELGMTSTHFENATGLDDTAQNHLTSALDIALMSRALIEHPTILKYSSIWMDTIRDGAFGLTNTNRLVRFYRGATGLKTGSTSKAGFCVSATAQRDGLSLICVIMGAESRDVRNAQATKLLDWGFANYALYAAPEQPQRELRVLGGVNDTCPLTFEPFSCILPKGKSSLVEQTITLPENLNAPLVPGDVVGEVKYTLEGKLLGISRIMAGAEVKKIGFWDVWQRLIAKMLLK